MLDMQIHQTSEKEMPKKTGAFSVINMDISRRIAFTEKLTLYIPSFGRITKKEKKEKGKDSWKQRKRKSRKKWR